MRWNVVTDVETRVHTVQYEQWDPELLLMGAPSGATPYGKEIMGVLTEKLTIKCVKIYNVPKASTLMMAFSKRILLVGQIRRKLYYQLRNLT